MKEKYCPKCEKPLQFKPEGTSKNGNRYNAFFACPDRECKYTENVPEKEGRRLSWEFQMKHDKSFAYGGAASRAMEIAVQYPEEERRVQFEAWFEYLYSHWENWYIKNIISEDETT